LLEESQEFSAKAFVHLLEKQREKTNATLALLSASLACELDCDVKNSKRALLGMTGMLPNIESQGECDQHYSYNFSLTQWMALLAALMEAVLIGMIKVTLQVTENPDKVKASIGKMKEAKGSSLVQHVGDVRSAYFFGEQDTDEHSFQPFP
jgi:hypothetical protein